MTIIETLGKPFFASGWVRSSRRRCGYTVNHSAPTLVWNDDLSKARLCGVLKRTSVSPFLTFSLPFVSPIHFPPMLHSSMLTSISCRRGLVGCLRLQVNWEKAGLGPNPIFYTASDDPQGRSREVPFPEERLRSKFRQGGAKRKWIARRETG